MSSSSSYASQQSSLSCMSSLSCSDSSFTLPSASSSDEKSCQQTHANKPIATTSSSLFGLSNNNFAHSAAILNGLKGLRENRILCDVTLIAESKLCKKCIFWRGSKFSAKLETCWFQKRTRLGLESFEIVYFRLDVSYKFGRTSG